MYIDLPTTIKKIKTYIQTYMLNGPYYSNIQKWVNFCILDD